MTSKYLPYLLLSLPLLLVLFFCLRIAYYKYKVRILPYHQKEEKLQQLLSPFGFQYDNSTDLFVSRVNAIQRSFGYTHTFDKAAISMNMILHALPVYFDYLGKTWLIEMWKGQYGITTGCECGIYYADRIISPEERKKALFHAIDDNSLLTMEMYLFNKNTKLLEYKQRHWWLAAFRLGTHFKPQSLTAAYRIYFPDCKMLTSFFSALQKITGPALNYYVQSNSVTIILPEEMPEKFSLYRHFALSLTKIYCKLFGAFTHSFTNSVDKVIYIYYFIPFIIRRILKQLSHHIVK